MNSAAKAIAWELWSRNRWANLGVVVVVPVVAILNSSWIGEWARLHEVLLLFFSFTVLFWTFCYVEVDARGRHAGFPSRMFTLPLQTVTLVGVPMIYGAVVVAALYLLWSQLVFPQWGTSLPASMVRIHLLMLTAMLFSVQAIVWSLHRFPWIRLAVLIGVLVTLGILGLAVPDFRMLSEAGAIATLSAIGMMAFGTAIAVVARDRRGEWAGWTQQAIDRLTARMPRRGRVFGSKGDAQVWFEWRGKAFFLSVVLALPMSFAMIIYPIPTALRFEGTSTYASLPILTLIMAWCLGMTLARTDYWTRETELSSFVTARPLSDGDIVVAKLKTAALVILMAGVIFAVLAIPVFNVPYWLSDAEGDWPSWSQFKSQNPELLLNISHPLVVLTALAVTWATMIEGLAIGLRGQKAVVIQSVLRIALFCGTLIAIAIVAKRPGGLRLLVAIVPWASALLMAWKAVTTIFWFNRARPLYSTTQRLWLVALWLLVVACVAGTARLVWTDSMLDRALILVAAFLVPGAALFRGAVSLHYNRHR